MKLRWSDVPPNGFDCDSVRPIVAKLVRFGPSTDKQVKDVLQARTGTNTRTKRARPDGTMAIAWNAVVTPLDVHGQPHKKIATRLWESDDSVKKVVTEVHTRAIKDEVKSFVTALTFNVKDAEGSDSRFTEGFHCVWLLDAGESQDGKLYFVAYDQDVTCSVRAETKWRALLDNISIEQQPHKEADVLPMMLNNPIAKRIVEGMILDGDNGNQLGPLIRFLYYIR